MHGIPDDPAARKKIRAGLSDAEKADFDEILKRIDQGQAPNRNQAKQIRKWKGQGKIKVPSKSFKSPSDKKTHQDS